MAASQFKNRRHFLFDLPDVFIWLSGFGGFEF
jgi:hypothetical protein